MRRCLGAVAAIVLPGISAANATDAAPDAATRRLAFDIFKQLIEINTADSVGNVSTAAKATEQRLLDAGFPRRRMACPAWPSIATMCAHKGATNVCASAPSTTASISTDAR